MHQVCVAAGTSALLAGGAHAQNLVNNGGFETPVIPSADGLRDFGNAAAPTNWDFFPDGTTGLDWSVEWTDDASPGNLEIQTSGLVVGAREGGQLAELDSHSRSNDGTIPDRGPELASISQDVLTCVLSDYDLAYSYQPRGATTQGMEVEFDDLLINTHNPGNHVSNAANGWQDVTAVVTPSLGTTTKIRFTETGTANQLGSLLDAVSLAATSATANACDVVDIKPGSFPNATNICNGKGVVPIAIVGSADLDPFDWDVVSIAIAGITLEIIGRGKNADCKEEDVIDGTQTAENPGGPDGQDDFVCHVNAEELAGFVDGATTDLQVCVMFFDGTDTIEICDTDSIKLTKTSCL